MLKDTSKAYHLYLESDGTYGLYPFEMLPTPSKASAVRAYLFERHGKRVIAYWHTTGSGTLTLPVGENGAAVSRPADRLRYWETDLSAEDVRSAYSKGTLE